MFWRGSKILCAIQILVVTTEKYITIMTDVNIYISQYKLCWRTNLQHLQPFRPFYNPSETYSSRETFLLHYQHRKM